MKERPILFSGPMVRAILEGRKTQTRRAVKPQPFYCSLLPNPIFPKNERERAEQSGLIWPNVKEEILERCPSGKPGDRLWVRESWRMFNSADECACYDSCDCSRMHGKPLYLATDDDDVSKWKPSIHMPRWASRITLEITSVKVERLQDISEADAIAEGVPKTWQYADTYLTPAGDFSCAQVAFQRLWESINGAGSWAQNPWVWVIEFNRVKP